MTGEKLRTNICIEAIARQGKERKIKFGDEKRAF